MREISCHEEKIHLCGKVQFFGYLFIFDEEGCIAASENCFDITGLETVSLLKKSLEEILYLIVPVPSLSIKQIEEEISDKIFYRYVERIKIKDDDFFLSIYRYNERLYLEMEACNPAAVKTTKLYYYAKYLESHRQDGSAWQSLTELIQKITHYDRVMVYQFLEDNSGKVIAECKHAELEPLLGYRYPEFDIPSQARELYRVFHARHTADIDGITYNMMGRCAEDLDLTRCSVRALSPLHLQYLRNSGAKASASFSIIVEGKLWGLVACQNREPLHVDLSQRHLCIFLTQYAVNYYLAESQKENVALQRNLAEFEQDLKGDLLVKSNLQKVLESFSGRIMDLIRAQGIIIKHAQGFHAMGEVPDNIILRRIEEAIGEEEFFVTEKFISDTDFEGEDNCPGFVRIAILPSNNWYLYVFRGPRIIEETWAGKPEKIMSLDQERQITFPSPRSSFEAWKKITHGKAEKWLTSELTFIKNIKYIVQQAVAQRGGELEELNKKLIRSNNALDTFGYTLTHDLKNPLTSIHLTAQMLLHNKQVTDEFFAKSLQNIVDNARLMNDMMDKVYTMSKVTNVELKFEIIEPRSKILNIVESCRLRYGSDDLDFNLGETLPILGERTLVYQLFLNLIGNAIKYSSKQPVPVVQVDSYRKVDSTIYRIEDNGIGMDMAKVDSIFEIFSRMPNTEGYEGNGIGLSIVKQIAAKLNASVTIESELNAGTTFFVEFRDPVA
ncbi:histidine kinase [Sphingobacterium sp. Ag1]|uniref:ATP-binding protein n=1 Tax=Sphingobacterium sp. Ag1 TaxID=1643451 RepID=UPI000627D26E|nr:ATP-binding protein [Sphingobacterium sp. Ag1]KKO89208.1 histidine kinase [Sphingobacterium sp. Ag1]